ncbi:cell division protein FtsA [Patescibacteria group bacterium]
MAKEEFICGIDVGSAMVRVAIGQQPTEENTAAHIVGAAEHPAEGVSKGSISSIEDTVSSISQALEQAERMTGVPIEQAFVGVNGTHVVSQDSHGVIAVAKSDGEIREEDVSRVIEAAQAVATPANYEILHVIPRSFTVDNQKGIKDPIGMTGIRLEVDAQIIQALSSQIKNLTKCIYRTSVDINDLVLGLLAAAECTLNHRQKDLGVTLINIGSSTTGVMVFEEGDVLHTKILPVGSAHLTNDIAIGLRTSIDLAEQVKLNYGTALPEAVNKRDEVNLGELGGDEGVISHKHIAEIIEARVEEIFTMVDKELQSIDRSGLLPAGVVLIGGGAKLSGMVEVAKRVFRLPAVIGTPQSVTTAIDKVKDPAFATSVGLVKWGTGFDNQTGFSLSNLSSVKDVTKKMRGWFKSLMP